MNTFSACRVIRGDSLITHEVFDSRRFSNDLIDLYHLLKFNERVI